MTARHTPEQTDEADYPGFLDHLDLASIDDLCDRHGFAKAREMIFFRLSERANGRPVCIDHIQEAH